MGEGSIERFVDGRFMPPGQARPFACPIRSVVIADSLNGAEQGLVRTLGLGTAPAVVSDPNTYEVLGRRIEQALRPVVSVVLEQPHADEATAARLASRTRHADALITVGSGTLNDLCKHVGHRTNRPCAVFATAPSMNGYTTSTVSISRDGYKQSLAAQAPAGVFLDLAVLAAAPVRMIRAGLGDVLCRSSAQVDWLLSHLLLGTAYSEDPFAIQAADEQVLLDRAGGLPARDPAAIGALVRLLVLSGLGMLLVGSSHPGSMGEHAISHYIDMFLRPHPGSLHGEQVGVASRTMARLQALILARDEPPRVAPGRLDVAAMRHRYGHLADDCLAVMRKRTLDAAGADALNQHLEQRWPAIAARLQGIALPPARIEQAMVAAGAAMRPEDLGIDPAFYRDAVLHAREIRDRYAMLDLAAEAGLLQAFVERDV